MLEKGESLPNAEVISWRGSGLGSKCLQVYLISADAFLRRAGRAPAPHGGPERPRNPPQLRDSAEQRQNEHRNGTNGPGMVGTEALSGILGMGGKSAHRTHTARSPRCCAGAKRGNPIKKTCPPPVPQPPCRAANIPRVLSGLVTAVFILLNLTNPQWGGGGGCY